MNAKSSVELIGGLVGTTLTGAGAGLSTNEVLEIVSTILTIIGAVMTLIVIPLLNWYRNAKKDGKITSDEIRDGVDIVANGMNEVNNSINKDKKEGE